MFIKHIIFLVSLLFIFGCQEDLLTSNQENNMSHEPFIIEDFIIKLNTNQADSKIESLSDRLNNHDGVVLYFTMWCPVCDNHMQSIRNDLVVQYANIDFVFIDYVSASATSSRATQLNNGYSDFDVISDTDGYLEDTLQGSMGSLVLIDKNFTVVFSEVFKSHLDLVVAIEGL